MSSRSENQRKSMSPSPGAPIKALKSTDSLPSLTISIPKTAPDKKNTPEWNATMPSRSKRPFSPRLSITTISKTSVLDLDIEISILSNFRDWKDMFRRSAGPVQMYLPELSQKELQECLEQPEVLSDYKACAENPSQLSFGFTDELGFCRTDPSFTCSKLDYSEKSSKQKESTYEDENIDPEQSEANIFARLFIEAIIPQGWI